MIPLSAQDRACIDGAIDAAFDRLDSRLESLTGDMRPLAGAMRRAAAGGKRFRPALVVAAYRACGGEAPGDPVFQVAAAFELLHTAFVVHDDVIDRDTERRGEPNVAGEFAARARAQGVPDTGANLLGETAGILAGDVLLHEATRMIALAELPSAARAALLDLLDDAVLVSAAGELSDVSNAVRQDCPDTAELLVTTHDKTAVYSFAAPLRAGAALAGAPAATDAALGRSGALAGLAFQLVDDLIGAFSPAAQAGRAEGADLRAAKRTPLVSLARESAAWTQVDDAIALAWTGPVAVRDAQRALDASGARTRLVELVQGTLAEARVAAADDALPSPATLLLAQLCDAIGARIP
ncbi:polyprenyl synthetase family protein [Microbacterium sp. zg.Y1090]|uniref:polyprenyl synthetase family protein n=1 Tax=Microbacterium TaxID=33882 RepID=UPI00214B49A1|nr:MULTISPECIES: polyprenyl synthetase family protein [unclassified Microbacterium]MCR2812046.1 polyprenyl synthetase family protein [Microbacterium sp. zg.Y1084]MCR2818515.1 polyprenyl synthetase family protein [Microbacterium sp. zg.Y1090]MDL5486328.1 polyprenyl synthetase family protein [Microbacterium sp. zg-Y1211]WIM29523.1 polyprenyl synthetase family protein [Microbacterium sp. zg-Y1090]